MSAERGARRSSFNPHDKGRSGWEAGAPCRSPVREVVVCVHWQRVKAHNHEVPQPTWIIHYRKPAPYVARRAGATDREVSPVSTLAGPAAYDRSRSLAWLIENHIR